MLCQLDVPYHNVLVNYHTMNSCSLLLASLMPAGMDSLNRSDWLVDIPLPGEGGYLLSLSGIAPQPGSSRELETCIPSPYGEHAAGTNVFLRTVQLTRLTLQESALPFQVWTGYSWHGIMKRFAFIPSPGQGSFRSQMIKPWWGFSVNFKIS